MPDLFIAKNKSQPEDVKSALTSLAKGEMPFFAAYREYPDGVSFTSQEYDEHILLFLRRHIITNLGWVLATIILFIIPLLLSLFLPNLSTITINFSLPSRFTTILALFYYLIVLGYAFISFITWFYNISFVTEKRVVDLDFSDVLYKNIAATKIDLIEDVDFTQAGFARTFFNYGDVFVQTAAAVDKFDFKAVPKPARVVNIIEDLIGERPHGP